MRKEGEYSRIGDTLKEFLGMPTPTVIGILKPTGTALDLAHIVNQLSFEVIASGSTLLGVNDVGTLKLFAFMTSPASIPPAFRSIITPLSLEPRIVDGKRTNPIFVGADEAKMMIEKGLFKNPGDVIDGFFGNRVLIAGVLPKTKTILDQLHFVPGTLRIRN